MSRLKTTIIFIVIILIHILAAMIIVRSGGQEPKESRAPTLPLINTLAVSAQSYTHYVNTQGRVQSRETTLLSAEVGGRVDWIADDFREGKTLNKGTLIARIDDTQYVANLAQAQFTLAQAELALEEEQLRGVQAREDWEALHVGGDHRDRSANDLVLRKPHQQQAAARVDAAQAAVKQAQRDLRAAHIRLPFDAIIDDRHISVGQFLNTGAPIAQLLGKDREVRLPLTPLQRSTLESETTDVVLQHGQQRWEASLTHIDANLEPATQVIYATAGLPADSNIPVGLFVSAQIRASTLERALVLPASAIKQNAQNQNIVFSLEKRDGKHYLKAHPVVLSVKSKDQWVLDLSTNHALETGMPIVITRLPLMTDGMQVALPAIKPGEEADE